jgi:CheY-like chemotaxis protein
MSGQNAAQAALIYVVDDEEFIVKLTILILRQAGMRVRGFTDPFQALEAIRGEAEAPALLMTDFEMRPLNGVGLIRESKKLQPSLKTVLVSGSAMDETEEAMARQVNMDRFLIKPVPNEELVRVVQELLGIPAKPPVARPSLSQEHSRL